MIQGHDVPVCVKEGHTLPGHSPWVCWFDSWTKVRAEDSGNVTLVGNSPCDWSVIEGLLPGWFADARTSQMQYGSLSAAALAFVHSGNGGGAHGEAPLMCPF